MKRIRDAMTANPRTIEPSTTIQEAARYIRDENVGSLPIVEGGKLVGILTDRDIAIRAIAEGRDGSATAGEIASKDIVTVDPAQSLDEAMQVMSKHQVRRVPVCEEDGRLVGILAQADIALDGGEEAETGQMVEQISR
jgi:CBS domain-containing protein